MAPGIGLWVSLPQPRRVPAHPMSVTELCKRGVERWKGRVWCRYVIAMGMLVLPSQIITQISSLLPLTVRRKEICPSK